MTRLHVWLEQTGTDEAGGDGQAGLATAPVAVQTLHFDMEEASRQAAIDVCIAAYVRGARTSAAAVLALRR